MYAVPTRSTVIAAVFAVNNVITLLFVEPYIRKAPGLAIVAKTKVDALNSPPSKVPE
jgi:hypothetical protein